jgi:aminoglycoside 3-N-acetyltransferase
MLGELSPIGSLYHLNAKVCLLGVDYSSCTCLHLAEYRSVCKKTLIEEGTAVMVDGLRKWVKFQTIEFDSDDFNNIGNEFEKHCKVVIGKVGNADVKVFNVRDIVDFAVEWMNAHRPS